MSSFSSLWSGPGFNSTFSRGRSGCLTILLLVSGSSSTFSQARSESLAVLLRVSGSIA